MDDLLRKQLEELEAMAVHLEGPIQTRLREDITYAFRLGDGMSTEEILSQPVDYSSISSQFPEGLRPDTIGEARDILFRSNIPGFFKLATNRYRSGGDFWDTFQQQSLSFYESFTNPKRVGDEPYASMRQARWAGTKLINAEEGQRPRGSYSFEAIEEQADMDDYGGAFGADVTDTNDYFGGKYTGPVYTQFNPPPDLNRIARKKFAQMAAQLPGGWARRQFGRNVVRMQKMFGMSAHDLYNQYYTGFDVTRGHFGQHKAIVLEDEAPVKYYVGQDDAMFGEPLKADLEWYDRESEAVRRLNEAPGPGKRYYHFADLKEYPSTTPAWKLLQETEIRLSNIGPQGRFQQFLATELSASVGAKIAPNASGRFRKFISGFKGGWVQPFLDKYDTGYKLARAADLSSRTDVYWAEAAVVDDLVTQGIDPVSARAAAKNYVAGQVAAEKLNPIEVTVPAPKRGGLARPKAHHEYDPIEQSSFDLDPTTNPQLYRQRSSRGISHLVPTGDPAIDNILSIGHGAVGRKGHGVQPIPMSQEERSRRINAFLNTAALPDEEQVPGEHQFGDRYPEDTAYTGGGIPRGPRPPSGGGPPEEPPADYFPPESWEEEPEPGNADFARGMYPPRAETMQIASSIGAGRNAIAALPPGWGKTEPIRMSIAARGGGVSLLVTPQTSLNKQLERRLRYGDDPQRSPEEIDALGEREMDAYFLPGDPGYGASPEEVAYYKSQHEGFFKAIHSATEETPGTNRRRWKSGAKHVVGIMSSEKFAAMSETSLGEGMQDLHREGLLRLTIFDEAQEIMRVGGGREAMKVLAQTQQELFPNTPTLLTGGTITRSDQAEMARIWNVAEGDIVRKDIDLGHINIQAHALRRKDYVKAGADFAQNAGEGAKMVYSYGTRQVEQIRNTLVNRGVNALMYHKGKGDTGPMTPEQLQEVEDIFNSEVIPSDRPVSLSSAGGLGLNIRNVKHVGQIGPATASDIIQRMARIRPMRDPTTGEALPGNVGEFYFGVDPDQYEEFAEGIESDLGALTPEVVASAYRAVAPLGRDRNWRRSSEEISAQTGEYLETRGIGKYRGAEVFSMLREAGFITQRTFAEGEGADQASFRNWSFEAQGDVATLADRLTNMTWKHPKTNQELGFGEYKSTIAGFQAREYRALGDITRQAMMLPPDEAGELIRGGLEAYQQGGLEGMENYAGAGLPAKVAEKYVQAVQAATEVFQAQVAAGKSMNEASVQFTQTLNQANQMLNNNPGAAAMAPGALYQAGVAQTAAGSQQVGAAMMGLVQSNVVGGGVAGVAPPNIPPGGGGGGGFPYYGGGGGGNQRMWGGSMGRALYGVYIASRFWRMFAGEIPQQAEQYAGYAASAGAMDYYGQGEYTLTGAAAYPSQKALADYYKGQTSYQLAGPIMGAVNRATIQSPGLRMLAQGGQIAAGIAAGGFALTNGLLAGFGIGAWAPAGPIGLAGAAGVLAYTGYRYMQSEQELNELAGLNERQATGEQPDRTRRSSRGAFPSTARRDPLEEGERARLIAERHPSVLRTAEVLAQQAQIPMEEAIAGTAQWLQVTGEVVTPSMQGFGQLAELSDLAKAEGVSLESMISGGASYAESLGGVPGTDEFALSVMGYGRMGIEDRYRASSRASRVNQFAGMFSQYFQTNNQARAFVRNNQINTAGQAQALQQAMALGSEFGVDFGRTAGYTAVGAAAGAPYSIADSLARMQQRLGTYRMGLATSLASSYMTVAGQDFGQAMGQYEALGMSNASQVAAARQWMQTAESYGFSGASTGGLGAASMMTTPATAGVLGGIGERFYATGRYGPDIMNTLAGYGMTTQQAGWMAGTMSGNLRDASQLGRSMNIPGLQFYDIANQPQYMHNPQAFLNLTQAQRGIGNEWAQKIFYGVNSSMTPAQQFQTGFGNLGINVSNADAQIWAEGGGYARTLAHNQRMYGFQMAGIGIQLQQIALQRQYYWGSGSWQNPSADSMWGMEDQMREMQHVSTLTDFQKQRERMEMQRGFSIEQEGITGERMATTQAYQRWMRGFDREQMDLSRRWTREDWGFQDNQRNMTFGWEMEDINEAIRFSSGRERRQLVRQRERMTTQFNLEGESISRQRGRQDELWEKEDERFEKQAEYQESLMRLEQEQFDLSKRMREEYYNFDIAELERRQKEYQKQYDLQTKIIDKQREFQAKQLELQEAALGVQAAAAKEAKDYADQMAGAQTWQELMAETWKNIIDDHPEIMLEWLEKASAQMKDVPVDVLKGYEQSAIALRDVDPRNATSIRDVIVSIDNVSVAKSSGLADLFDKVSGISSSQAGTIATIFGNAGKVSNAGTLSSVFSNMAKLDSNKLSQLSKVLSQIADLP